MQQKVGQAGSGSRKPAPAMETVLESLGKAADRMGGYERDMLAWWLQRWSWLIRSRDDFRLEDVPPLRRGDIFLADLGVNVGSEEGYEHFCLVVEANNPWAADTVLVVPLSSYKGGRLRRGEIDLGFVIPPIPGDSAKRSIAVCGQLRALSKRRILRWKGMWHLQEDRMPAVDAALIELQFGARAAEAMRQTAATIDKSR